MTPLFPNLLPASRIDLHFSEFYRSRLRRLPQARVRSSALLEAYHVWAEEAGADSIGFRDLRRLMRERGHGHFYSNGATYRDVVVASAGTADVPIDDANVIAARLDRDERLVARIDAAIAELSAVRSTLLGRAP